MKQMNTKLNALVFAVALFMVSLTSCDDAAFNQSFSMDGDDMVFAVKPDSDNPGKTLFGGTDRVLNSTLQSAASKAGFDMNKVQSVKLKNLDCTIDDSLATADPNITAFIVDDVKNLSINIRKSSAAATDNIILTKDGYTKAGSVFNPNLEDVELKDLITSNEDLITTWTLTLKNPIDHAFKIKAKVGYALTVQVGG